MINELELPSPVYLGCWADPHHWNPTGKEGLLADFGIDSAVLEPCSILIAEYDLFNYEGSAFVLFVKDGKLYEVAAYHCSCFGLEEDGWKPEETTAGAILKRNLLKKYGESFLPIYNFLKILEGQ